MRWKRRQNNSTQQLAPKTKLFKFTKTKRILNSP